jgi:RNA polymerase sigma factor (sigma-70 family)
MNAQAPAQTTSALIVRVASGDRAAFRALYQAEAPRLLGVAMRMLKRRMLAEEAVHDTFMRVWDQANRFDASMGNGQSWLFTLLRNRALNILRGEARTDLTAEFETMNLESDDENPEEIVLKLSEAGALRRCLETLDASRRQAILLAYVNGLTHVELAERLGMPLGTIKSWMRRSLLSLRECLG